MNSRVPPDDEKGPKPARKPKPTAAMATSTNVSSPASKTFERRNARREQEDDFDSNSEIDTFAFPEDSYAHDDFVVDDNDEDDDYFEAVSRRPARKLLGEGSEPITTDTTMDGLPNVHKYLVDEFVQKGREECQEIVMSKNLRSQPFTDLVLRDMAIHFPTDLKALLKITDVNPESAARYGPRLLKLVARTKERYDEMMHPEEHPTQKPRDPNHETVINLISDDEDPEQFTSDEFTDDEPDEMSNHFRPRSLGSQLKSAETEEVEMFNARFSSDAPRNDDQPKNPAYQNARPGSKQYFNVYTSGTNGARKGSASNTFRPKKRAAYGKRKSKGSRPSRGDRDGGSRAGGSGGGIRMMPG
jgi:bloom syndrome protein